MNSFSSFRLHPGILKQLPFSDVCLVVLMLIILIVHIGISLHIINGRLTAEVSVRAGEINEGIVGVPVHKNPLFAASVVEHDVAVLLHAGLLRHNRAGGLVPNLAEHWERKGAAYTFRIRKNARFHDGTTLDVDDVLYTADMIRRLGQDNPHRNAWEGVTISALNTHTVLITVPEGNLAFPEEFTVPILPKHIWQKIPEDTWRRYAGSGVYVGAGPFRHENEILTIDGRLLRLTFAAFNDYAPGKPYIKKISFHFFTDADMLLEAFSRGRIDAVHSIAAAETAAILSHSENNDVLYTANTDRVFGIFFNTEDGRILQDPFLRSVLSRSVDRDSIIRDVFRGLGTPLAAPIATDTETAERTVSPEEIQQTLEDIGWIFEDVHNSRKRDGIPLRMSLVFLDTPEKRQTADILIEGWQELGFDIEARALPPEVMEQVIEEKQFDMLLYGYEADRPKDLVALWKSGDRKNIASVTGFGSPILNTLLTEMEHGTPPERLTGDDNWREIVYTDIKQEMMKRVPAVFLYSPYFLYILPENIFGVSAEKKHLGRVHQPSDRFMNIHTWYMQKEKVWKFLAAAQ